jgi:uncharacterized protein YecE (DUF72 family)
MPNRYTGCSGFHYKEWKNVFYPDGLPQSRWFGFYCTHFNTLELNVTFYKFPTERSLSKWYSSSPDDFRFSVKVPRAITHYKKFNDCEKMLDDFYNSVQTGLMQKLGCILFQLPPQVVYSGEFLEKMLGLIDPSFKNVIEFRHPSWWDPAVFDTLQEHGIIFCGTSYPGLPNGIVKNSDTLYYRLHGVPVLYKSPYPAVFLRKLEKDMSKMKPKETWVYFNNTWGTAAIENATFFQSLVKKA